MNSFENKKQVIILVAIACLAILYFYFYSESDEQKIHAQLSLLEETVSKEPNDSILIILDKVQTIKTIFHKDCYLQLPAQRSNIDNLEDLSNLVAQALKMIREVQVRFHKIQIQIQSENRATTLLRTQVDGPRASRYDDQPFRFHWSKEGGIWKIKQVSYLEEEE